MLNRIVAGNLPVRHMLYWILPRQLRPQVVNNGLSILKPLAKGAWPQLQCKDRKEGELGSLYNCCPASRVVTQ